jgi:hypothetical protein
MPGSAITPRRPSAALPRRGMPGSAVIVVAFALVATAARAEGPAATPVVDPLAALLARTDAVAKEVAKVRGLRLKNKIPNEVVDRAELRKRLLEEASEDKTAVDTAAHGLALQRWGLVPLDYDYSARLVDLLADQIAGYYDSKTKKLTILDSAGSDPAWAEMVLAHELDHGLQDQAFDLEKFEKLADDDTDAITARHALVEGDGVALMIEVMLAREGITSPWSVPEAADEVIQAMSAPEATTKDSLDAAPLALREEMLFPYRDGFAFVTAIRRTKPWSAIDAVFRRPPRSTEQILHVDKYLADDKPIAVRVAPASPLDGYTVLTSDVWGELGMRSFLLTHGVSELVAENAAAGWGGDRVITLAHPGETNTRRTIGVARFEWDTEVDAREAQAALEHAMDDMMIGSFEQTMEMTRWYTLDGTASWVERKGKAVAIVIGAPMQLADKLDPWTELSAKRGNR